MTKSTQPAGPGELDPGAIAMKVGLEILKRTVPTGIAWITTYARGINLLMIGPSGSGKTSFSDYLVHGVLSPESQHITTVEEDPSPTFSISVGSNESLKLRVRRSLDEPGQIGPMAHANLIKEKRPHAVLIIMDSTSTVADIDEWMREFCEHSERVFREDPGLVKKIRSFIICLNKRDKVANLQHFKARSRAVRDSLRAGLGPALGSHYVKAVPVMACVSISGTKYGSSLIDAVIAILAKQVR